MKKNFQEYFGEVYAERWSTLYTALQKDKEYVNISLTGEYFVDEASVLAMREVEVRDDFQILDLCSAPGGKIISLLSNLSVSNVSIVCNEISTKRRMRLLQNLKDHLPEKMNEKINVLGLDGIILSQKNKESFDLVILDAPCSSERHVIDHKEEQGWKENTYKKNASLQWSLLASAFEACKSGGEIIYMTCSLNPVENDEVVRKLFKKRKNLFEINKQFKDSRGELTEFGKIYLPDREKIGPLYLAKIKKN
ncbi:MAG: hypothetical protein H6621_11885 [Halobacteriovoraceae bacterium]|nr:hypothetical protein [Halobacteriovoraceae bacterium]